MRNTITKTVSMFLVAVMVMGIAVMPMRASAGQKEINDYTSNILTLISLVNSTSGNVQEQNKQNLKNYFPASWDSDSAVVEVSISDLEGIANVLTTNGIGSSFVSLYNSEYSVDIWYLRCVSVDAFPVNINGYYSPGGRFIVAVPDGKGAADGGSRPSYTAPSAPSIETTLVYDSTTNTYVEVEVNNFDQSVTNNTTNNNHYWDVDNRQFWDVENNTYTTYNSLTYNPSTQTYNVQFSDNRSYTYQFYYDYTYITYIGSSAEYREAYKVYYELPDGRSSGDLTADELKGLSLQFDMVNYDKAASDTLTRALYPFDGDVENVSYFENNATWVIGASTEYLEASEGFGGALVYDEKLKSRLNFIADTPFDVSDGFTIQMRLYFYGSPSGGSFNILFNGDAIFPRSSASWAGSTINWSTGDSSLTNWYDFLSIWNNGITVREWTGVDFDSDEYGLGSFDFAPKSIPVGQWFDFTIVYVPPSAGFVSTTFEQYYNDPTYSGRYYVYVNGVLIATQVYKPYSSYTSAAYFRYVKGDSGVAWDSTSSEVGQAYAAPPLTSFRGLSIFSPLTDGNLVLIDNLRIVNTALYTGVQSFTPTPVPFDTNLVYVLPSVAGLNDNTVAIMSQLPVSGYRVGGIRPTDPTLAAGYVYMHIDGEFVDSVQQYNGSYWEEVTARLYTGVRWIPVTAFNVYTLEDMFDIIDPDADGGGNSVDSIYQYYLWWSGEWGSFQQWLQGTMATLIEAIQNSGSGGSGGPVVIVPGYNDQTTTNEIITENPDGSTTVTTVVSNAAGLVYSRSVTTWPADADGNVTTREVYTDSTGVMYQTTIVTDKDGNVTVTEPTQATGTLGAILKMITSGVMSIAGTVIEGFVTIVVDGVKFIIDSADKVLSGMGDLITQAAGSIQDLVDSVSPNIDTGPDQEADSTVESVGFLDGILMIYPSQFRNAFNAMVLIGISLGLLALFIL